MGGQPDDLQEPHLGGSHTYRSNIAQSERERERERDRERERAQAVDDKGKRCFFGEPTMCGSGSVVSRAALWHPWILHYRQKSRSWPGLLC